MVTQTRLPNSEDAVAPLRPAPAASRHAPVRGKVWLAHPGTQHSAHAAAALERAGLLGRFETGLYIKREGIVAQAARRLPGARAEMFARRLAARSHPTLPPERIRTHAALEAAYLLMTRCSPVKHWTGVTLRWRNWRFDRAVSRSLTRGLPAGIICYDSCAIQTFRAARRLGIRAILDQSTGLLESGARLYREEAELQPEFADPLAHDIPQELIAQCTAEALLADCILSPSDYVTRTLVASGISPERIASVPFGVDLERFVPGPPRRDGKFRILYAGRLSQRKGISYLLEAFRRLRLPDAELVLIGPRVGADRGLRRYQDVFRWIPPLAHDELAAWHQRADLFVLPSLHEGSALATYEALASGLPVVATPNAGSVVRDGREGFLVPIRDVDALAEKILLLYRDPERRREMSIAARLRAEEFPWSSYYARLGRVVEEVIASRLRGEACA